MKTIPAFFLILALLAGCSTEPAVQAPAPSAESVAIDSLNEQIEKFNAEDRPGNMGVSPIDQRAARIEHDPKLDQLTCFDKDDKPLLVLNREPDGRFKGTLEVEYHELVGSGPDGSHSWGHIVAEFYVEKGVF